MRRIAWLLLVLFAFTIPWEYSLNLGEPWGNIARIVGILVLLAAMPAVLQARCFRRWGPMQWLVLAFYFWMWLTVFWSIDTATTLDRMRGYFQEMMLVWLVWEFADDPEDLRWLMRGYVAGSWILAVHSMASLRSAEAVALDQIRFVAPGQDPNDVARYLDLGIILAATLLAVEIRRGWRLFALLFLPAGAVAVVLTASRGGFLGLLIAVPGCALVLAKAQPRLFARGAIALPALAIALSAVAPRGTLERLATIPAQLHGGDLNQRLHIWHVGWDAFARAPVFGTGAGTFTSAARTDYVDTAHNTALSIAVGGGLCALLLATGIAALAMWYTLKMRGPLRIAFATALLVWAAISTVDTLEENRTTWLLLGMVGLAGRLMEEQPAPTLACFPTRRDAGHANHAGRKPGLRANAADAQEGAAL